MIDVWQLKDTVATRELGALRFIGFAFLSWTAGPGVQPRECAAAHVRISCRIRCLAGTAARQLAHGRPVPCWAWSAALNTCPHASAHGALMRA
jgi:hypothetical protein